MSKEADKTGPKDAKGGDDGINTDRAQYAALGKYFEDVASGRVKPFDREAFDRRPKIARMGFSPEELARLDRARPDRK